MKIVSQKSDDKWLLRCYDPGGNRGGFHAWYDRRAPEIAAAIDSTLEILRGTAKWSMPSYRPLEGDCDGLDEIRIEIPLDTDDGSTTSLRILGFFGPGKRSFTMLRGFIKLTGSEYSAECPKALNLAEIVRKHGDRAPTFEN